MEKPVSIAALVFSGLDQETKQAAFELWSKVMAPMVPYYGQTIAGRCAEAAMRTCFGIAEESFSAICSRHNVEFWLPQIRKTSGKFMGSNAETYAWLGLLKYAATTEDQSALPLNETGTNFSIGLLFQRDDLLNTSRLLYLASLLDAIGNTYRWVGKGCELEPTEEFPIRRRAAEEVDAAVEFYERRRPSDALFRDQGLLYNSQSRDQGIHFVGLARINSRRFTVSKWRESWPAVRMIVPLPANTAIQILGGYSEAIQDLYGVRLDALFHFLTGLAANIFNSVPSFDFTETGDIALLPREGEEEQGFKSRVQFLLTFVDKGYFRFPRATWLENMARVRSPWAQSDAESRELTEEFFQGFCLDDNRRTMIDISTLRPVPFCFKTAKDWVYVDVQSTGDFLAHLLESAKDWFGTQHGDRFTLAVKRLIQTNLPEVEIVGWKREVSSEGQRVNEVDILLATDSALWVVECKAIAKSPEFFRGDRDAVRWRTLKLKSAFEQVRRQSVAVQDAISSGEDWIPIRKRIEIVVCTPAQEFIYPMNAFGFIAENIPRICTPEELLRALTLSP